MGNREAAILWWSSLSDLNKLQLMNNYNLGERHTNSLTGREIENIYNNNNNNDVKQKKILVVGELNNDNNYRIIEALVNLKGSDNVIVMGTDSINNNSDKELNKMMEREIIGNNTLKLNHSDYLMENIYNELLEYPPLTKKLRGAKYESIRNSNETPKISRNAQCPCGSEKKYKRCCGNK